MVARTSPWAAAHRRHLFHFHTRGDQETAWVLSRLDHISQPSHCVGDLLGRCAAKSQDKPLTRGHAEIARRQRPKPKVLACGLLRNGPITSSRRGNGEIIRSPVLGLFRRRCPHCRCAKYRHLEACTFGRDTFECNDFLIRSTHRCAISSFF
jgi:hypothetical protein